MLALSKRAPPIARSYRSRSRVPINGKWLTTINLRVSTSSLLLSSSICVELRVREERMRIDLLLEYMIYESLYIKSFLKSIWKSSTGMG
jgi:hypothetical protein